LPKSVLPFHRNSEGVILKKLFFTLFASIGFFALAVMLIVPAVAQNSNTGMPREPTTKAGKCAKANGGTWTPSRGGWYTRDRLGYQKCMSS
jgi:hypothetical protein